MAVLVVAGFAGANEELPFSRAIYRPSSSYWRYNFTRLGESGIDAYYGNGGNWLWPDEYYEEKYGLESLEAAENNITYIAGPYYMQVNWDRIDFNYTRAVGPDGVVEVHTPSPIDETWWYLMVEEPALITANLSLNYPIWGIVWDMELYGHDTFVPTYYTYDDRAMEEFSNETGTRIPPLATNERYFWLRENELLDDYRGWMRDRVYTMAESTAEKVHEINPNLSMGILYFEDCWFYWTILDAFMTQQAPVTGWNEQSYTGFRLGGEEGIDTYQQMWDDHGLNGKFLPGLGSVEVWEVLTHTEAMLRQNEAMWLYFGNRYPQHRDPGYELIFKTIEHYFYFNRSEADPVPIFHLSPGVEARAYRGPKEGASIFLTPYRTKEKGTLPIEVVRNFTVITESQDLVYVGKNLSRKKIQLEGDEDLFLNPGEIPCVLAGLKDQDLIKTEVFAMVQEMESLLGFNQELGLCNFTQINRDLSNVKEAIDRGDYSSSQGMMADLREDAYNRLLEKVKPMVEQGLSNPRDSPIPLNLLRTLSNAERTLEEGKSVPGQAYLYDGLAKWSKAISEASNLALLPFLYALSLHFSSRNGLRE